MQLGLFFQGIFFIGIVGGAIGGTNALMDYMKSHETQPIHHNHHLLVEVDISKTSLKDYVNDGDLYTQDNIKNFLCKVTVTSASNQIADSSPSASSPILDACEIYKYPINTKTTANFGDIDVPKDENAPKNVKELYQDNYFQVVFSEKNYSSFKNQDNLTITLVNSSEETQEFASLAPLAWYEKNEIYVKESEKKEEKQKQLNEKMNTTYLLVQKASDSNSNPSASGDLYTNNTKNFQCQLKASGGGSSEATQTDNTCEIYKVEPTDKRIVAKELYNPASDKKITQKSDIADNKYYQISVNKAKFNALNASTDVVIDVVESQNSNQKFAQFKTIYEFKKNQKWGKVDTILAEVVFKDSESLSSSDENSKPTYKLIDKNGTEQEIKVFNLSGSTITNKAEEVKSSHFENIPTQDDQKIKWEEVRSGCFYILKANTKIFNLDEINKRNTIKATISNESKTATFKVKYMDPINMETTNTATVSV